MSTWTLMVDGVDVTDAIVYKDAQFTSAVNGRAGNCHFRVKDANQTHFFTVGKEITLDVDGVRSWGGYVMQIKRGYWFDSYDCRCKVNLTPRYWEVEGSDYNILFERRVLYDKVIPENGDLTSFPAGTADNTVIDYYITNHLDLSGDGLGTSLVQHVGTPSTDTVIQGGAGWTWSAFMRWITSVTGAIYYIRPDKEVVHTDVETADAPFGISDDPIAGEVGCRDLEIDFDGSNLVNDALVWGAGQGSTSPVFSRSTDAASITEHGRWQLGAPFQAIWKQSTADSVASTYVYGSPQSLRGGKDDKISAQCAVYTAGLVCGQKVPLRSAVFGFTKTIPIRSMKITFPTKTDVKWDLVLSHEIDQPWTGFDFFPFPPLPPFPVLDINIPNFPSNNPCADGNCLDTFSRTGYAGASEFGGFTYSNNAFILTDGDHLGFWSDTSNPGVTHSYYDGLQFGFPIDLTFDFTQTDDRFNGAGSIFFRLGSNLGDVLDTAGNQRGVFSMRSPFLNDLGQLLAGRPAEGDPSILFFGVPNFHPFHTYRFRLYLDNLAFWVKVWSVVGPEPAEWGAQLTLPDPMPEPNIIDWGNFPASNVYSMHEWARIDNLRIYQGLHCIGNGEIGSRPPSRIIFDNFNRTVVGGLGTSTFGAIWDDTSFPSAAVGVDGSAMFVSTDYNNPQSASLFTHFFDGAPWAGGPLFTLRFSFRFETVTATIQSLLIRFDFVDQVLIQVSSVNGNGIIKLVGQDAPAQTFDKTDWIANEWYTLEMRRDYTNDQLSYNLWRISDINDAQGAGGYSNGGVSNPYLPTNNRVDLSVSAVTSRFGLDEIEIDKGEATLCVDVTIPADPPVGYTCQNLTRIATPDGIDPSLTYFQTANIYRPGTTKVWVNGLRIAWYDYDEYPAEALVVMHANVPVGGGDVFDPPAIVYACYVGG